MSYSKSIAIVLTTFVCATALAVDAGAQSRGGGSRGGSSGGSRGPSAGQAAPRGGGQAQRGGPGPSAGARYPSGGHAPGYRYPYYGYGYRYGGYGYGYGYPGFSLGLSFGYPYGYYGYGYPYYGAYGYSYPGYAYPYAGAAVVVPGGGYAAYGGVKIQGAPRNVEVYVDGAYAGIVDDYNGTFERLDLTPGAHVVEIRTPGQPLTYDVNVAPGQTITIHANGR